MARIPAGHGSPVSFLDPIDFSAEGFGEQYDELPLWSAPFGMLLLDRVPMRAGQTVLDLGAGTGFLTIELAQRCGLSSRVIAVDPWKSGMDRLRHKVEQRTLSNIELLEQDAAMLDLPQASLDVIVSNLGVNNFEDPARVLEVCFRAAKPGAVLVLTTNLAGHMAEFYQVFRRVLIESGQTDRVPVLDTHIAHRGTVESVAALLQNAGFTLTETVTDSIRMRFADGSALLRHHFIRLGFMPGWKLVASPEQIDQTFERLEHQLNALARQHGELSLTVPMACLVARK